MIHVGQAGAPPLGTLDPDILRFCERERRLLVTQNRTSMPLHIAAYFQEGGEHWGIFEITEPADIGKLANDLHLFWSLEEAEQMKNSITYL